MWNMLVKMWFFAVPTGQSKTHTHKEKRKTKTYTFIANEWRSLMILSLFLRLIRFSGAFAIVLQNFSNAIITQWLKLRSHSNVCVCASRWFLLHLMLSIHSQCSVLTKPVCLTSFHAFHIAMEDTTFERESSFARRFQQLIHTVRKSIALKSRNALAKMFGYEKKRERASERKFAVNKYHV